ncbi:MAG TPA: flagellar hook-length control protein FliK [Acidimicrobiia bacterium]|nr:flagellar hook-length control protein FliK [Acidimicrobiia bacterium]
MNLLPISPPAAPGNGAAVDAAGTTSSGDFAALVAMLVATASTTLPTQRPPTEMPPALPEPAVSGSMAEPEVTAPAAAVFAPVPAPFAAGPFPPVSDMRAATAPEMPLGETPGPRHTGGPVPVMPGAGDPAAIPAAGDLERAGNSATVPAIAREGTGEQVSAVSPSRQAPMPADPPAEAPVAFAPVLPKPSEHRDGGVPAEESPVSAVDGPRTDGAPAPGPDRPRGAEPDHTTSAFATSAPQVPAVPADQRVRRHDVPMPEKAEGPAAPKIDTTPSSSAGAASPAVPLVAVARSDALISADAPTATPVAPPAVPDQIVSAVVPLHGRGDGRHEVTLELRPDHLGTIRVEVTVEHQTVHLALHAVEPETNRLLAAALPELRTALADAGLTAGHLGVGPDGGGNAGQWRNPSGTGDTDGAAASGGRQGAPTSEEPEPARPVHPAAAGRLDLFL